MWVRDVGLRTRDLAVIVITVVATVAADMAARAWLSGLISGHPMVLGPVVLRLHQHVAPAFGISDFATPELMIGLAVTAAVVVLMLRSVGIIRSSVSAGLVVGGAVAYVIDIADDRAIVEYFEVGPVPAFGVTGLAIAAGTVGELLDRWARNDPRSGAGRGVSAGIGMSEPKR